MQKIRVGLYGHNGHQIQARLVTHPYAELVAVADLDATRLPEPLRERAGLRRYATLAELLADEHVDLVSLCAPRRREQAAEAIRCLEAGKHVYAEKPCAMTEADLDALLRAAQRTGRRFHEMAGTAWEQPYAEMGRIVRAGVLGTIVQVLAQKSYPYADWRPQDEDVDGGLLLQVGVHALRFIEHVAGVRAAAVTAVETGLGNPHRGGLQLAASLAVRLENGGVASVVLNYLNPLGFGQWGHEELRIFGTAGFVEAVDGGRRTRLVVGGEDRGPLVCTEPSRDYFDLCLAELRGGAPLPGTLEDELHPTRMVIRARAAAQAAGLTGEHTR